MSEQSLLPIAVQPAISYPREAEVGKTYLMTIDLQVVEGSEWQFEEEEYPIYCMVDSEPLFSCKAVGEPAIVLHRFGGSYGAANFLLTATSRETKGSIKLNFVNGYGVPISVLRLKTKLLNLRAATSLNLRAVTSNEIDLLARLRDGQLLMVSSRRRNGLILLKGFHAEFAGPGAIIGGLIDIDCERVIAVGNVSLTYPRTYDERQKAYLVRRQWVRLLQQITEHSTPQRRVEIILMQFANFFGLEVTDQLEDNAIALLVGVFPQTVCQARCTLSLDLDINSDPLEIGALLDQQ